MINSKIIVGLTIGLNLMCVELVAATGVEENAKIVLNKFLLGEYNGDGSVRDDDKIVRYNIKLQREYDDRIGGASIYLVYDPLKIVTKYRIDKINCKNDICTAIVDFDQVAKALLTKTDRKIIKDVVNTANKYKIKLIDGRWYVYDPPVMMISLKSLIQYYESQIKLESSIDTSKDNDTSRVKLFKKNLSDLSLLRLIERDRRKP